MRCRASVAVAYSPLSEILELSEERLMLEQRLSTVKARLEELAAQACQLLAKADGGERDEQLYAGAVENRSS
jgi:hypothetical protein